MMRKIKNFVNIKEKKGFTLIETLVAITVLVISILGPLQIAANALFSAYHSRDEITAYYLAAEAIEYIKNTRDSTFLNDVIQAPPTGNTDWFLNLRECIEQTSVSKGCTINTIAPYTYPGAVEPCNIATGCTEPLSYCDDSGVSGVSGAGLWGYNRSVDTTSNLATKCAGTVVASRFTRSVEIIPQPNNGNLTEALIVVTVSWRGTGNIGGEKKVTLNALMTAWQRMF